MLANRASTKPGRSRRAIHWINSRKNFPAVRLLPERLCPLESNGPILSERDCRGKAAETLALGRQSAFRAALSYAAFLSNEDSRAFHWKKYDQRRGAIRSAVDSDA